MSGWTFVKTPYESLKAAKKAEHNRKRSKLNNSLEWTREAKQVERTALDVCWAGHVVLDGRTGD